MTNEQIIVNDLQVRCVAYSLLRKFPSRMASSLDSVGILPTARRWAVLLEIPNPDEFGTLAYRAWEKMVRE